MAKDGGDVIASWAFHIHETGIGALQQALLMFPVVFWRGIQEILWERHVLMGRLSLLESFFSFLFFSFFFFLMGTSFEAFIELVTVLLLLFYVGP